jgi:FkbM family methyltransferase
MDRMTVYRTLRENYRDLRNFGPAMFARGVRGKDKRGYARVSTRFGRFYIRPSETDLKVLRQIFIDREYDLEVVPQGKVIREIYNTILERGGTPLIIDAGANVGFAARFFAMSYPKARIVSIEPDAGNAALCRENTKGVPQIEVIEAGVGGEAGYVAVERGDAGAWGVRTRRADVGVPVVTINDLASRYAGAELLIVKVDIEGFESELFSAATDWLEETPVLIVEPHDWMLPGAGTSASLQRRMMTGKCDLLIRGENLVWVQVPRQ